MSKSKSEGAEGAPEKEAAAAQAQEGAQDTPPDGGAPQNAGEATAPANKPKARSGPKAKPEPMPGLIEGRTVHYVLPDGPRRGEHRAAIISYIHDHVAGLVNLHVLLNGVMDYPHKDYPGNSWLVEKVEFSEAGAEGKWHWIERA